MRLRHWLGRWGGSEIHVVRRADVLSGDECAVRDERTGAVYVCLQERRILKTLI